MGNLETKTLTHSRSLVSATPPPLPPPRDTHLIIVTVAGISARLDGRSAGTEHGDGRPDRVAAGVGPRLQTTPVEQL